MFQRFIDQRVIDALSASDLFREKLMPDILTGVVFPAVRVGYVDFYYKGGRLFEFKREFATHKKYTSVIKSDKDYISESDFPQKIQMIEDFADGYKQIKKNCSLYAGDESIGVSSVYHKHPFTMKDADIVVLDIEVSFKSQSENKKQERIDILLFNKKTRQLRFYEAKHFSNSEIWSNAGKRPKVVSQINKYEAQISGERDRILEQYSKYAEVMNRLFECDIPEPKEIDEKVTLLVFGFDRDQLRGRLKKLLLDDSSLEGMPYYFIGDISKVQIENMWSAIKCS
jgi:hypothetical protein